MEGESPTLKKLFIKNKWKFKTISTARLLGNILELDKESYDSPFIVELTKIASIHSVNNTWLAGGVNAVKSLQIWIFL